MQLYALRGGGGGVEVGDCCNTEIDELMRLEDCRFCYASVVEV